MIRLTQIDGKLPNIALMKLSHYFKNVKNEHVYFTKDINKSLFEENYNYVFGSAIFTKSKNKIELFLKNFPNAILGGTGINNIDTIEKLIELNQYEYYDYSIYPGVDYSIGFSQRGCRLKCEFCYVPKKEGKNQKQSSIYNIYKQNPNNSKKKIMLLDNDFFGQSNFKEKAEEIISGKYKICFSQGINIRLIKKQGAKLLAQMKYMDTDFKRKRIYTAWDNSKDEDLFLKGINLLLEEGIKPSDILVYFLCNYWEKGLTEDVLYRFNKMKSIGLLPYPMIYEKESSSFELKKFQEYVIQGIYRVSDFKDFINKNLYKKNKQIKISNLSIWSN